MAEAKPLKYSYCGKEYQFISIIKSFVEKFLCPICQELLFEPVQTSCGHLFCGRCLKRSKLRNHCPSCHTQFRREPLEDKFNEREVKNLIVKCSSNSRGCVWEGELGNVSSHVNDVCGYQLVQCPNKCGEEMERRDIKKHRKNDCELREYLCPYCLPWPPYHSTYKNVTTVHFEECGGFPLDCPNCGEKGIRRMDMPSHLAACPEQVVPCRYQSLGCKARLPRKQMEQHMKDKDTHLEIAMATTTEIVDELNRVKTESREAMDKLQKQVDALLEKTDTKVDLSPPKTPPKPWLKEDVSFPLYPPCTVKVELDKDGRGNSSHFITHPGGYRLIMSIVCGIIIFILHVKGPNDDSLRWPVRITVKFLVLNQKDDRGHCKYTCSGLITHPSAQLGALYILQDDVLRLPNYYNTYDFKQDGNVYIKVESADIMYK